MASHKQKQDPRREYPFNLSTEERINILANAIVDRTIEEEKKFNERQKKDPKAKRIYEMCECPKCKKNTSNKTA